jgi:hypothetical protein
MMTIRDWRGTKEGRAALRAFPGRKVRELAALVEPRPGFRDAAARRRFATAVRLWAHLWLCQERRHKRWRPEPTTPAVRRDSLCELAEKAARAAQWAAESCDGLRTLPDEARDLLAANTDTIGSLDEASPFSSLSPEARRWAEGRDTLRALEGILAESAGRLAALAAAAERAADSAHKVVRRGRRDRSLGPAVKDLAQIWLDATGRAPTRTWDEYRRKRAGPFPAFVYAAIAPLWPKAKSVDGLIDNVCTEFRSRTGN